MTTYKNTGSTSVDFTLGPDKYESIRPGEAKALSVPSDNRMLRSFIKAGVLVQVNAAEARAANKSSAKE